MLIDRIIDRSDFFYTICTNENPVILENTRIFLSSTDPDVACITDNVASYGDLTPGEAASNPPSDTLNLRQG